MQRIVLLTGAAALVAFGASAFAQGSAKSTTPRSAASIQCSQQADAKGLHGKERKLFRSKCIRGMAKAPATKSTPMRGYR